jgi:hypothetical protein
MPADQSSASSARAPRRLRRAAAVAATGLCLAGASGCGAGHNRNEVPASPIGGPPGAQTLPSEGKLDRRIAQARRQGARLKHRLRHTNRIAKKASK